MRYDKFDVSESKELFNFLQKNLNLLNYRKFYDEEEFKDSIIDSLFEKHTTIFLCKLDCKIIGISIVNYGTEYDSINEEFKKTGYLTLLLVEKDYQNAGIGSKLFNISKEYLFSNYITEIKVSHKSPLKFEWCIPEYEAYHNKAPGVIVESDGYKFLINRNFKVDSTEISYYMSLDNFELTNEMIELENYSLKKGYEVVFFDEDKHHGQEEMFTRLKDESYRSKFKQAVEEDNRILILVKDDSLICGIVGHIFAENNGRGFFQGIAVDPLHGGQKLGNLLFYSLCINLKKLGASYMTLFVSEDNFAKYIYEKTGFVQVRKWAILSLREDLE